MQRKYSERVRAMLDEWNEETTISFVECNGVSKRNWRMFCLKAGVVDGHMWKLREIASEYKLTIARVSKILATVQNCLGRSGENCARLYPTWGYRTVRRQILSKSKIVNASEVNALTSYFRKNILTSQFTKVPYPKVQKCLNEESCVIVFIANGKCWRKVSAGRLCRDVDWPYEYIPFINEYWQKYANKQVHFPGYTIFWMEEDVKGLGNQATRIVGDMHCIRESYLVFDCGGSFWVMDKVDIFRNRKKVVVRLKPAEHDSSEIKE